MGQEKEFGKVWITNDIVLISYLKSDVGDTMKREGTKRKEIFSRFY